MNKYSSLKPMCIFFSFICLTFNLYLNAEDRIDDKFDSAHSVLIEAVLPEGQIITNTEFKSSIYAQIEDQLFYTVGQLNGLDGGAPDMNRTQVDIKNIVSIGNGSFQATYSAKLWIAWPKDRVVPEKFIFILPKTTFSSTFYSLYGSDENSFKRCLDWGAHGVSSSIFWYYYRPEKADCPLKNIENNDVFRLTTYFSISKENTENKSPEYNKIWEDKKLIITAIFGKAEEGASDDGDDGIASYVSTVNEVILRFGTPKSTSVSLENNRFKNGTAHPEIYLTFESPKGLIDVALFLVEGIRATGPDFQVKYNQRTTNSDFVSYSGHSGLGANIRALARMGKFIKGQYQIFMINGCDTFAYVDNALRDAHHRVNPESAPDKFFDVITNAMPSYFYMNSHSNMSVINSLYEEKKTYREILGLFSADQRSVVTGEQDNN